MRRHLYFLNQKLANQTRICLRINLPHISSTYTYLDFKNSPILAALHNSTVIMSSAYYDNFINDTNPDITEFYRTFGAHQATDEGTYEVSSTGSASFRSPAPANNQFCFTDHAITLGLPEEELPQILEATRAEGSSLFLYRACQARQYRSSCGSRWLSVENIADQPMPRRWAAF